MGHYLKFAGIFFGSMVLGAFVLGLLSTLPARLGLPLVVLGVLTLIVALGIGAVVLLVHGIRCAREVRDPLLQAVAVLTSPLLTLGVLIAILPLATFGHHLGRLARPIERVRVEHGPPINVQDPPPPIYVRPTPLENSPGGH